MSSIQRFKNYMDIMTSEPLFVNVDSGFQALSRIRNSEPCDVVVLAVAEEMVTPCGAGSKNAIIVLKKDGGTAGCLSWVCGCGEIRDCDFYQDLSNFINAVSKNFGGEKEAIVREFLEARNED